METALQEPITTAPAAKTVKPKIAYIDHLKVLMTILVVLHHTFITYGAPGGWYYQQMATNMGAIFPMTVFVATNQSFFMGFFFFLSALFTGPSYRKKGAAKFIADRLIRLGIPMVFYSLILSPVMIYAVGHYGYGRYASFTGYISGFDDWIDFGVLWFAAALLVFNLGYVFFQLSGIKLKIKAILPSNLTLVLAGVSLGLLSFIARLWFPTGWTLKPLGFQLGYFPQYIALFIAGIVATNNNWLEQLKLKQGNLMARLAIPMVTVLLPAQFVLYLVLKFPVSNFNGGWNFPSLAYSAWEQLTGLMIMMALLSIAKFKWNTGTAFMNKLSANAFAVYIFHPAVVIGLSLLAKNWAVDPAVKLLFVAPTAVALSFVLAGILRKISFVRAII